MKLLLDTNIAIWWLSGDLRLSPNTRRAIRDVPDAFLSTISLREIFLVAQARVEGLTIVTADRLIPGYGVPVLAA